MKIGKTFTFAAAHQLPNEDCYGACSNMHGHTYTLKVIIEGRVNEKGWVMNFKDLKRIVQKYVDQYDHTLLNDHFEVSTAELMGIEMFKNINKDLIMHEVKLDSLTLWETPTSFITVTDEDLCS